MKRVQVPFQEGQTLGPALVSKIQRVAGGANARTGAIHLGGASVPHPLLYLLHCQGDGPGKPRLPSRRGGLSVAVGLEKGWGIVDWKLGKVLWKTDEHKVTQLCPHDQLVEVIGKGQVEELRGPYLMNERLRVCGEKRIVLLRCPTIVQIGFF